MGEIASARTERELADLRAAIDRDVDALIGRARQDVDPRDLVRRQPLAVAGSLGSVAVAAVVGLLRRGRERRTVDGRVDAVIEQLGGRISKLRGNDRKAFRKQLRTALAQVAGGGPKAAAVSALTSALGGLAMAMAQGFARRLLRDGPSPRDDAT